VAFFLEEGKFRPFGKIKSNRLNGRWRIWQASDPAPQASTAITSEAVPWQQAIAVAGFASARGYLTVKEKFCH
jgi:hypothetical protein